MSSYFGNFRECDVPKRLQQLKITRMGRASQRFLIEYQYTAHDSQHITLDIRFEIKEDLWDTMEEFRKAAIKKLELRNNPQLIQQIMTELQSDEYCRKILAYREYDANDIAAAEAAIGEPKNSNGNAMILLR